MKSFLLTLVSIFLIGNICIAQDWSKNGIWYHSTQNQIGPYYNYGTSISAYVKDTLINGTLCSKIQVGCGCGPQFISVYNSGNKVFYMDTGSGQFQLLYDFNKAAGDSFTVRLFNDSVTILIDSVKYETYNGRQVKTQYIHENGLYDFGSKIYEGIGSDLCLFPVYMACDGYPAGVKCYEDTVNGLYKFSEIACDTSYYIITSVTDKDNDIQVALNPTITSGSITISSNAFIESISFIDLTGRRLKTVTNLSAGVNHFSIHDLSPGIYLVEIAKGKETVTKRIVKVE